MGPKGVKNVFGQLPSTSGPQRGRRGAGCGHRQPCSAAVVTQRQVGSTAVSQALLDSGHCSRVAGEAVWVLDGWRCFTLGMVCVCLIGFSEVWSRGEMCKE